MKELLYIPSGRYVRWFAAGKNIPVASLGEFESDLYRSIDFIIHNLKHFRYRKEIYYYAEIPYSADPTDPIPDSFFEIIETED